MQNVRSQSTIDSAQLGPLGPWEQTDPQKNLT